MAEDAQAPVRVVDAPERSRYEAFIGDQKVGELVYERRPEAIDLIHTGVFEDFRGMGVGETLAEAAFSDVRAAGGKLIPSCPFIRSYLEDHPEHRDLVWAP